MSKQPDPTRPFDPFDPFGAWRTARETSVEAWSKALIDLVSTEPSPTQWVVPWMPI